MRNERLLELDHLKDEFVALVSHELRTPLTSIRGYLELVLDGEAGEVTDEQRQFLGVVERNANRLLDARRRPALPRPDRGGQALPGVRRGRPRSRRGRVRRDRAAARRGKGDHAHPRDGPARRSSQATGRGSRSSSTTSSRTRSSSRPRAAAWTCARARQRGNAILEVRDTGMGIPADEQEHVFERFFRTSRATEQAIQGTGLGLAISKAIVHAHGGRITLASDEGEGTTFRVTIPIRAGAAGRARTEEIALVSERASRARRRRRSGHPQPRHAAPRAGRLRGRRRTRRRARGRGGARAHAGPRRSSTSRCRSSTATRSRGGCGSTSRRARCRSSSSPHASRIRTLRAGSTAGADDYVKKPFSTADLRTRVQAALGR